MRQKWNPWIAAGIGAFVVGASSLAKHLPNPTSFDWLVAISAGTFAAMIFAGVVIGRNRSLK